MKLKLRNTNIRASLLTLGAIILVAGATWGENSGTTKIVLERGGQIFISTGPEVAEAQLTSEGTVNFLPAWSEDGAAIAFIEKGIDADSSLGTLVVIDERGRHVAAVELKGEPGSGMRFIEQLAWISPRKIAVSGSVNPSLTETRVIDLDHSKAVTEGIYDDGRGADFSPNGRHFAFATGSPHFTPNEFRSPSLEIDFQRVFPEEGQKIRFLSGRVWSQDGESLAVVSQNSSSKRTEVVIWKEGTDIERLPLQLPVGKRIQSLLWSSDKVLVEIGSDFWRLLEDGRLEPSADNDKAVLQERRGIALWKSLLAKTKAKGANSADFWCEDCDLRFLSKSVVLNDDNPIPAE